MAAEAEPLTQPLIASIVGTRPEAIKMLPVVRALADVGGIDQLVILTGQHRNLTAFDGLPGVEVHDLGADPREQTAGEICEGIHHLLCGNLSVRSPSLVLVQGDTASALAGARAAADCGIPLGHVEAGLRSFDIDFPWPEEGYRIEIDRLSDLLFAPSESAAANLRRERLTGAIHVTGNSGIDALLHARGTQVEPTAWGDVRRPILVTCHRRENRGATLARVADALRRLVQELPVRVIFLLHTNPHLCADVRALLDGEPHIELLPPVDHVQMVSLIDGCWAILTDSGGLQEEGPALGKPVLVLRDVTERVEAADSSRLVGTRAETIQAAVSALLDDADLYARMAKPCLPYGDGKAAPRIAAIIEQFLRNESRAAA